MKIRSLYGRAHDRVRTAQLRRKLDRSTSRADEPDNTVCECDSITARDVCPNCGCVRVPDVDRGVPR